MSVASAVRLAARTGSARARSRSATARPVLPVAPVTRADTAGTCQAYRVSVLGESDAVQLRQDEP